MGILYTSKLPRKAYPIESAHARDMVAGDMAFCVNCCEEFQTVESEGEYCESCDCESIFSAKYLIDRQWFVIVDITRNDV